MIALNFLFLKLETYYICSYKMLENVTIIINNIGTRCIMSMTHRELYLPF